MVSLTGRLCNPRRWFRCMLLANFPQYSIDSIGGHRLTIGICRRLRRVNLRLENRFPVLLVLVSVVVLSVSLGAQKVSVDADPAHVANTFSPPHALGAAIDRLRTGTPDHLLKDPLLKEILGAGWGTVTYRQNTELMVEAWHWN